MADWAPTQWLAFQWVLVALSLTTLLVRLYINFTGVRTVRAYRDVIVTMSWTLFFAMVIMNTVVCGNYYCEKLPDKFFALPASTQIETLKIGYAALFFNGPAVCFCKFDLLFLYHDLAPRRHNPKIFRFILVAWFFTVIATLIQVLVPLLACRPISINWSLTADHSCGLTHAYFIALWSTHILSDLLIYIIPLAIISRMHLMSTTAKLSAGVMFLIGFVNVAAATFSWFTLMFYYTESYGMWGAGMFVTFLQQATAIWIVCGPQCRSMWRLVFKREVEVKSKGGDNVGVEDVDGSVARRGSDESGKAEKESGIFGTVRFTARIQGAQITPNGGNVVYDADGDVERGIH